MITGGSRGIGLAAAKELARAGSRLVLAARSQKNLESAASELRSMGQEPELVQVELTDSESVRKSAERVLAAGPLDVLINCAGALTQGLLLDRDDDDLIEEMTLNYFGTMRMTRAVLPTMLERGSGTVVNVSSVLAAVGTPTTANYSASKAALEAFSTALRGEVRGQGVRVKVFVAPHTRTELGNKIEFRGIPSFDVEFVGRELARSVDSKRSTYCAGTYLRIGRQLANWVPGFMQRKLTASVAHLL